MGVFGGYFALSPRVFFSLMLTMTIESLQQDLKKLLTTAPILAYFDQSKKLEIYTDASAHGIGAALIQEGRPIAYASRALCDTEYRYAVIEKEMLAIVFALKK